MVSGGGKSKYTTVRVAGLIAGQTENLRSNLRVAKEASDGPNLISLYIYLLYIDRLFPTSILSYQGLRLSNLSKGRYDETFAGEDAQQGDIKVHWAGCLIVV